MSAVLPLGGADDCPACGKVHGQPGNWPQCPEHGHWMYEDGLEMNAAGFPTGNWRYACQAWNCAHKHTQPERATMTAATEATTAALAIRNGQREWDGKQLAALAQLGVDGAPPGDLEVFFHYCQATGLDPFAKQIRLRKDRQKVKDADGNERWQDRWSIETEIDGYRVIAHRAARRDGVTLSYGPTKWYDRAGGAHDIWLGDEPPAGASVTVYKDGAPFPAVVRLQSFAKYTQGGQLQAMWAVMPDHLLAKCAEAQALRKAFPHDLEGIRVSDEAAPAAPPPAIKRESPPPRKKPAPRERAPGNGPALRTAIGKQFDRLSLDDAEERKVYVYKLAGKEPGNDLTDHDLRFALSSLKDCGDIGELQELLTPPQPAAS